MDTELIAYLDRFREDLRADIATSAAAVREDFRTELATTAHRLRAEISADTTRHIEVVVEDFTSKLELVVEGIRTVDQRLDRFSGEVRTEFQKVDRRLLRLHARIIERRRRRPGP